MQQRRQIEKAYDGLILNGYDHYRIHHGSMNMLEVNVISMVLSPFETLLKGG